MLKSEQLYRDLENESALFDGENTTTQKGSEESLSHMQNWSLIGAALRNELPSKVNMSLADNVMAQIKNENIHGPNILVSRPNIIHDKNIF